MQMQSRVSVKAARSTHLLEDVQRCFSAQSRCVPLEERVLRQAHTTTTDYFMASCNPGCHDILLSTHAVMHQLQELLVSN